MNHLTHQDHVRLYEQRIHDLQHQIDRLRQQHIQQQNIQAQHQQLQKQNNLLQQQLQQLHVRVDELQQQVQTLEHSNRKLHQTVSRQKQQINETSLKKQTVQYRSISKAGRYKRIHQLKSVFQKICSKFSTDVTCVSVKLSIERAKDVQFTLLGVDNPADDGQERRARELMKQRILEVKDRQRIPYTALQALRHDAGLKDIPPRGQLQAEALRLATCISIIPITVPSGDGCVRTVADVIEYVLDLPENRPILNTDDRVIRIVMRFACDGAKLTKRKDSVRGVCKLIPPVVNGRFERKDSPEDEITLFLYMGKEDRCTLEEASRLTRQQMRAAFVDGVPVKDKIVRVKWIISSDWKALSLMKGVNSANANHFCLWCHCSKREITDFTKTWNTERNREEQQTCLLPDTEESFGYQAEDMFDWVPYTWVVPDELHLQMRITDKLLTQVVEWAIDQERKEDLVQEMKRLGIDFRFFEEEGSDGKGRIKKWTKLTGGDLKKTLKGLDIIKVLEPGPRHINNLNLLPRDLLKCALHSRTGREIPAATKKNTIVDRLQQLMTTEEQRELVASRGRLLTPDSWVYSRASPNTERSGPCRHQGNVGRVRATDGGHDFHPRVSERTDSISLPGASQAVGCTIHRQDV